MRKDPFKVVPNIYVILNRSGKYFLHLRSANVGYEQSQYSVIAGHVDGNETMKEAARREAKEETGIEIDLSDLEFVYTVHRKQPDQERVDFFFVAKKWSGEPAIMEPDKCDAIGWYAIEDFPANTVPRTRAAIQAIEKGEHYGEWGWD